MADRRSDRPRWYRLHRQQVASGCAETLLLTKIDGAFVKELAYASSDYAVVKSITEIAHFMKKRVVAEFVETNEVLEILREIGVDYAQGYVIDKPGPLDRLLHSETLH